MATVPRDDITTVPTRCDKRSHTIWMFTIGRATFFYFDSYDKTLGNENKTCMRFILQLSHSCNFHSVFSPDCFRWAQSPALVVQSPALEVQIPALENKGPTLEVQGPALEFRYSYITYQITM